MGLHCSATSVILAPDFPIFVRLFFANLVRFAAPPPLCLVDAVKNSSKDFLQNSGNLLGLLEASGHLLETSGQLTGKGRRIENILRNPFPNPPQIFSEPPQNLAKSIQNRPQRPLGARSWTHAGFKLALERSKTCPEASKSAQERLQTVPNPSQIEPKTLPNPLFK